MRTPRPEKQILADLRSLCGSPGYLHVIAYFCWRDNIIKYSGDKIVEKDLESQAAPERLLRTEIAVLIGYLSQFPVDTSLPAPPLFEEYVASTQALLEELHDALKAPWFTEFTPDLLGTEGWDPFSSGQSMREPIFYSGESAYSFQYRDFASDKYRNDCEWMRQNLSFETSEAVQVATALEKFQVRKIRSCLNNMKSQRPEDWTILPGFHFTIDELSQATGLQSDKTGLIIKKAFSCVIGECNHSFINFDDFNATNERPILQLSENNFILLQAYTLYEAIYDAPFFWLIADKNYSNISVSNRGKFTESFAARRLTSVFGQEKVKENVTFYSGKKMIAEADILVLYGDIAIVVQAKSKRLTIAARKGNDRQIKDDFGKAVQASYEQAMACAEALQSRDSVAKDKDGKEIFLITPRIIYPVCTLCDHYPALGFQSRQFLRLIEKNNVKPVLVADLFTIDVLCEMLDTPLHFLNYIDLRVTFAERFMVSNELTALGFHLNHNLWFDDKYSFTSLGDDFAGSLDIAMHARRTGIPGESVPTGILTRYFGTPTETLLVDIENAASTEAIEIGMFLLRLSGEGADDFNRNIKVLMRRAVRDRRHHDMSLQCDDTGITVHCNFEALHPAKEKLATHCTFRKYATKAKSWYGLSIEPVTGKIRIAVTAVGQWQEDRDLELAMKIFRPQPPVAPKSRRPTAAKEPGRNSLCPCGSGKKYKRCCLK